MRFDRRLITHFEWLMPLLALSVCGMGIAYVYSASHNPDTVGLTPLALRQITWMIAGCVGMMLLLTFDYRRLESMSALVYGLVLAGVMLVPIIGRVGGGSRRWITLGPVSLQPS